MQISDPADEIANLLVRVYEIHEVIIAEWKIDLHQIPFETIDAARRATDCAQPRRAAMIFLSAMGNCSSPRQRRPTLAGDFNPCHCPNF